jgi:hypothetical protein
MPSSGKAADRAVPLTRTKMTEADHANIIADLAAAVKRRDDYFEKLRKTKIDVPDYARGPMQV